MPKIIEAAKRVGGAVGAGLDAISDDIASRAARKHERLKEEMPANIAKIERHTRNISHCMMFFAVAFIVWVLITIWFALTSAQ